MKRQATLLAAIAAGALALAPAALGQAQARVHGKVTDSEGEALAGVRITVSDTETNAVLETASDDKGRYSVVLVSSTRPYLYQLELEGYQTLQEEFKAPINSNTVKNFELKTREEAATAVAAAAGAVESPQSRAIELYNTGAELARGGDPAGAREKFLAALELSPDLSPALTALAALDLEEGELRKALALADQAVALDPGDVNALTVRYQAYQKLGDEPQAAAALAALQAASPETRAATLYNEGVDAFNAGDIAGARAKFEAAVAAHEGLARAHYMLGLTLIGSGDSQGARGHLERFLELAPDDPDTATAREMLAYQ